MALERIDPIQQEDRLAVDHMLRYALAADLVEGKRVLDAACGLGFGSVLLAHSHAAHVIGLDNSKEALEICRDRWQLGNLEFIEGDLDNLEAVDLGETQVVTCFETLEHVRNPESLLKGFAKLLGKDGLLIGSVPGETDLGENNEFHLHHFSLESLKALLKDIFPEVKIYRQDFRLASSIEEVGADSKGLPFSWGEGRDLEMDFGKADKRADTYFFLASQSVLPELPPRANALSRQAWRILKSSQDRNISELDRFAGKYRALFAEYGDMKVKFGNSLAWGRWHYEKYNGETPSDEYVDRIAQKTSTREKQLREQVMELQQKLRSLEDALNKIDPEVRQLIEERVKSFNEASSALSEET